MALADHRERGAQWREQASELLTPITAALALPAGRKPAWDDLVMLDERRVHLAVQCLAQATGADDEYVETTGKARRRVGLAVLSVLRAEPSIDPVTAFEQVLNEPEHLLPERLAGWIEGLGRGGRAALAQEAVGYATAVATWVPPRLLRDVAVSAAGEWFSWSVPGRAVRVRGRCDACAPRGARPPDRRLLVVTGSLDQATETGGHAALAYTLALGSVPSRVTVLAPATGREVLEVGDDLLANALERVGAAAHAAVAARFGPPAPTTPGAWCRYCVALDDCPSGSAHIASTRVRIGGLPPLGP